MLKDHFLFCSSFHIRRTISFLRFISLRFVCRRTISFLRFISLSKDHFRDLLVVIKKYVKKVRRYPWKPLTSNLRLFCKYLHSKISIGFLRCKLYLSQINIHTSGHQYKHLHVILLDYGLQRGSYPYSSSSTTYCW